MSAEQTGSTPGSTAMPIVQFTDPVLRRGLSVVIWLMAAAVAGIASLAFWTSFEAILDFATHHGEQDHGWRVPLLVDTFVLVATLADLWCSATRTGQESKWQRVVLWWPKLLLAAAVTASFAFNVGHAKPDLGNRAVAAMPPVALVVSFELLMFITRRAIAARCYAVTLIGPTTRQLLPADSHRGSVIADATPPGQAAQIYAAHGIPVLPLRGKLPRIPRRAGGHGVHDATCDPDTIEAWWRRWPDANIGLRCGTSFDVIDVEVEGRRSLERLLAEHGGEPIGGPRVRTGSGGWHLYVEPTGLPDRVGVLEHVDYRAADRYVVAPPSRHPETGQPYRWVQGREVGTPLGLVPEGLRELLIPSARSTREPAPVVRPTAPDHPYGLAALQAECAELAATPKGERNRQLWESARNLYNLVAGGVLSEVQVEHAIRRAAQQCGLLEQEPRQTEATLASARKVGLAHPRSIPDPARAAADASPNQPPRPLPERIPER